MFNFLNLKKLWWALTGSNRRHSACKADALPTELSALIEKDNNHSLYTLHPLDQGIKRMAQRTGLEPATPGVTGRYSNQLNYRCTCNTLKIKYGHKLWWALTGSNRRHSACKADALPTELSALIEKDNNHSLYTLHPLDQGIKRMAQRTGLEPATPGVTGRYSNQLNYRCTFTISQLWGKRC